jgi:hypothetical protein
LGSSAPADARLGAEKLIPRSRPPRTRRSAARERERDASTTPSWRSARAHAHKGGQSTSRANTNASAHAAAKNPDGAPRAADAAQTARDKVASIDALADELGAPDAISAEVAFLGYDAVAGLDAGQSLATERILGAVRSSWPACAACGAPSRTSAARP